MRRRSRSEGRLRTASNAFFFVGLALLVDPARAEPPQSSLDMFVASARTSPARLELDREAFPATVRLAPPEAPSLDHHDVSHKGRAKPPERVAARPLLPRSNWAPYFGPFGLPEASHLLDRTVIGARFDEIDAAVAAGFAPTITELLSPSPPPSSPGDWATEPLPDISEFTPDQIDSLIMVYRERMELLRLWWGDLIIDAADPSIRENMVLFWHDHFATAGSAVILPQSMYVQNRLLREHALGNFRELVRAIYKDPAMLIWLDGNQNVNGNINENFARELLELFTLGLDHYTQDDVVAAARAFTGWRTNDGVTSQFYPLYHDRFDKTFLGHTGDWDGDDIVDFIFEEDETARFICRKLYRWLIDEFPDEILIEDLAGTLRASDYEVLPVLERMLSSAHFFDVNFRGSIIRNGIDRSLGAIRSLYIDDVVLIDNYMQGPGVWAFYSMVYLGQILFEPPNVAGWPGYRTWINASTLPNRKLLNVGLVDGDIGGYDLGMQLDAMEWASTLTNPHDPLQLVDDVALAFFGMPPTELVRQRMIDELLQGIEPWEWSLGDPEAESRIQGLIRLAIRLPDYQLK